MDHTAKNPAEEAVVSTVYHKEISEMSEGGLPDTTIFTFETNRTKGPNQKHDLRVITNGDDPWFIAKDVCAVLALSNPTVAVSRLDDDERTKFNLGQRGLGAALAVSESGLYDLIMQSRKPEAEAFKRWIRKDVLPAIRKDGGYIMGEEKLKSGEMSEDEFIMKAMSILQGKVDRITNERDEAIAERDLAHDTIGKCQHRLTRFVRTLPGVNTQMIKRDLFKLGYLYRKGKTYRVFARYQDLFKEKINEKFGSVDMYVTQQGKECILHHLKQGALTLKNGF